MSGQRATSIEATIYVRLLDEGTDVWRPVPAAEMPDGTFEIGRPDTYDPEAETWEFPPRSKVRCAARRFADGEAALVAVAYAD